MNSFISPILLPPNFVWRSYTGGSLLRRFRQAEGAGTDDHFPEDWLASTVRARNPGRDDPAEGISRIEFEGREVLWTDFLREHAGKLLGRGRSSPGLLAKLLDSSVRLHIQAHPSREFARRKLESEFGKTECWYVLSTRHADAHVHLGFQRPPSQAKWLRIVLEQDLEAMYGCFEKIAVKPGDCFMVPAGVPHAIGEGIFMVELQEPSDWVVRCEWDVGGCRLPEEARWMGLPPGECAEMFDYREYSRDKVDRLFRQSPRCLARGNAWRHEEIVGAQWHGFFRLHRLRGHGPAEWKGGEGTIAIVTSGAGALGEATMASGETCFLPAARDEWEWRPERDDEAWEILLALPPVAEH